MHVHRVTRYVDSHLSHTSRGFSVHLYLHRYGLRNEAHACILSPVMKTSLDSAWNHCQSTSRSVWWRHPSRPVTPFPVHESTARFVRFLRIHERDEYHPNDSVLTQSRPSRHPIHRYTQTKEVECVTIERPCVLLHQVPRYRIQSLREIRIAVLRLTSSWREFQGKSDVYQTHLALRFAYDDSVVEPSLHTGLIHRMQCRLVLLPRSA